jgi:hypothetical protein
MAGSRSITSRNTSRAASPATTASITWVPPSVVRA